MTTALFVRVVITVYVAHAHPAPLRCGGFYDPTAEPWAAVDVDALDGWQCGDRIRITAAGQVRVLVVRDSGPLSRYCVEWGDDCLPIVADIPEFAAWFPGLSARAEVVNLTEAARRMEAPNE